MTKAFHHLRDTFLALVRFMRETLSEGGVGSFSRVGCAVLIAAYVRVMIKGGRVPDNSESFATLLIALYGANSLKGVLTGVRKGWTAQGANLSQGAASDAPDTPAPGPA